ncbi:MAG TPA: glycosyltransferase family 2 protein [Candidatus Nanopelagicaceae bacterium]|nr:glycosyltransferase family 2 protein [Candidatus Nanopelagicaceae bacterium]
MSPAFIIDAPSAGAPPRVGVLPTYVPPEKRNRVALPVPGHQRRQQRLWEMAPGVLVWACLLAPVAAGFVITFTNFEYLWLLGVFAVILDLYWLVKLVHTFRFVVRGIRILEQTQAIDWTERLATISLPPGAPDPAEVVHAVLIPTYTERYETLRATVGALAAASYARDRKIVAIITRETDLDGCRNVAQLQEEFGDSFRAFWHIKDPLLPGIVVGKSAAMSYAGPVLARGCAGLGLDPQRLIVTDLDSDYRVHPQYFSYITYHYCEAADRLTSIWQPVPLFLNNLWRVPAAVRSMATLSTQWQLYLHQHPKRLVMFSAYSMSMQLVTEVGFWDDDVIPEDSRFFWKAFFTYGERLHVHGAFMPMYGDAPRAADYGSTLVSQYNQIKRWAWGVTDVPYVAARMPAHPEIPVRLRLQRFQMLIFNHLSWATVPLLILIAGSLPSFFNYDYGLSTTGGLLEFVASLILQTTLLNILAVAVLDNRLQPRPPGWNWWRRRAADLQTVIYPIVFLVLSVIPALEAQTRLLFGSHLEYRVTEKH